MKIPPGAKQVFKGVIYDVYQWDQERFDGSTATYEMITRPHSAMVIATKGDKILLSQQEQPRTGQYYSLFGGQMDEGEDPLIAAKRELREETGMESNDWELYKEFEPMHKFDWTMYIYIARNAQVITSQQLDPGEKIKIIELDFDRFIHIVEFENFWGRELTLDVFRMEKEGKLMEFKEKILNPKS